MSCARTAQAGLASTVHPHHTLCPSLTFPLHESRSLKQNCRLVGCKMPFFFLILREFFLTLKRTEDKTREGQEGVGLYVLFEHGTDTEMQEASLYQHAGEKCVMYSCWSYGLNRDRQSALFLCPLCVTWVTQRHGKG